MADGFEGKVIADKYEVGTLISAGPTGNLYRGRHVLMDKPEMLKLLSRELAADNRVVSRFFEQARVAGKISQANVLDLTDFGSDTDGTPYAVFEGVSVESLKSLLERAGRLSAASATDVARHAAAALAAAHHAGVVHGGLTTANILVPEADGDVKVFDFAAPVSADSEHATYSAPELFDGSSPDARSDVYSLGVVLYEMLAGEPPFHGEAPAEIRLKHAEEAPPPLSAFRGDLPATLEPVVLKALAKDPDLRYQTADEFAADLSAVAGGTPTAAAVDAPSNNIWKTAFIVLAGISLLSAFLIYATTSKQTNPRTALQSDANGQPVQPINPATGAEEQNLSVPGLTAEQMMNTNTAVPPGTLPGGDGYDPWARGGVPPPGAPAFPKGGQVITIDPNNPSQFMPNESGVILVPVPANTNNTAKPAPTPKTPAANANTATTPPTSKTGEPKASPTPAGKNPATPQQKPTPAAKPTRKPGEDVE
jgi:serine/threonine protein kinase